MKLRPVPIKLREANDFVEQYHRHNKRTQRDGGRFAIGATTGEEMVGVAIVGRPISQGYWMMVTRLKSLDVVSWTMPLRVLAHFCMAVAGESGSKWAVRGW